MDFEFADDKRCSIYVENVNKTGRTTGNNVAAFFQATFKAWKDYKHTGNESVYVGYSPIIIVDAEKILHDLPNAHILHIVRNPWSAYADTKKRPVPLSMAAYMRAWVMNQYYALYFQKKYPDRVHVLRIEDVMADSAKVLGNLCKMLDLDPNVDSLNYPSWNGEQLDEVYPWGTLRKVQPDTNKATAEELSQEEKAAIREYTWQYLDVFGYGDFI
jgi:hypothetical protein